MARLPLQVQRHARGKMSATNLKAADADESAEPANDQAAEAPSGEAE
jgi:hypothetical protein